MHIYISDYIYHVVRYIQLRIQHFLVRSLLVSQKFFLLSKHYLPLLSAVMAMIYNHFKVISIIFTIRTMYINFTVTVVIINRRWWIIQALPLPGQMLWVTCRPWCFWFTICILMSSFFFIIVVKSVTDGIVLATLVWQFRVKWKKMCIKMTGFPVELSPLPPFSYYTLDICRFQKGLKLYLTIYTILIYMYNVVELRVVASQIISLMKFTTTMLEVIVLFLKSHVFVGLRHSICLT